MPEDAYTSKATLQKLKDSEIIISRHIQNHIASKGDVSPYLFCDMNSGDGKNFIVSENKTFDGSFYTAYNLIKKYGLKSWYLAGFEVEKLYYEKLILGITKLPNEDRKRIIAYNLDNAWARSRLIAYNHYRGLAYCDPSGYFQLSALKSISEDFKNVDILINANCTQIKRTEHKRSNINPITLADKLSQIDKKHWFISDYRGRLQWAFLYGTNNPESIAGIGGLLLSINDDGLGSHRFKMVNLTEKEISKEAA